VLLLDQRGTGRSTPVTAGTVGQLPADRLAAYLKLFRADSIVADAELIRHRLAGGARWETLGQRLRRLRHADVPVAAPPRRSPPAT